MAGLVPSASAAVAHRTVTSRPDTGVRVIVNVAWPPSVTAASAMDSAGGSSSSVILIVASDTVSDPAEPVRVSASSFSSSLSFVGVSVKSAWALDFPAGIVIVKEASDAV